jgi:hypothetical protein
MYEYYPVIGEVRQISDDDAHKLMDEISSQWEGERTPFGRLTYGVYNWAYTETPTEIKLHIPKLNGGGEIPLNTSAKAKFGFDVYGDCFLKI